MSQVNLQIYLPPFSTRNAKSQLTICNLIVFPSKSIVLIFYKKTIKHNTTLYSKLIIIIITPTISNAP